MYESFSASGNSFKTQIITGPFVNANLASLMTYASCSHLVVHIISGK